ncbi:propionyl-CoA synthetase [Euzebya tangerina]|uniref:propionyl-CoA synthetase n=1 Tax=Euzebya tangerina TaxID=591198 RepID=UPI000E30C95F|nr:propionyl-CoA synthetase [Euzebya tangerina]
MADTYRAVYDHAAADPAGFWLEQATAIDWDTAPQTALDDSRPPFYRWFPDGRLNTCFNAVDRHVRDGRADQPAIVHDSAYTGEVTTLTYADLLDRVSRLAGGLRERGVQQGDRVIIYMPMIPEAVIAMLACARLGAIHSVVFGGFAAKELATRIADAKPSAIIAASCGLEPSRIVAYKPLVDTAIEMVEEADRPAVVVVKQRPQATAAMGERDVDYDEVAAAEPVECVTVAATDPLYILYTSGTTGTPKGVVRDNGGHAVALAWSMANVYGVQPGEVYWAASDVGWVVGHSYICYGPLIHGCTSVMFEGKPVGTPDAGAFWRVIADHGVAVLFTAPTAFRAIKRVDADAVALQGRDLGPFRTLFLAGERCDPDTLEWSGEILGVPVIDHWWQTETGYPISANPMGIEQLPVKPGSATVPMPGWDVQILDQAGEHAEPGEIGSVVVKLPLPPGAFPTLWNDEERYVSSYMSRYPGYYLTGDAGMIDADGYLSIMSRIDDIINVAGHRLSTGAMEEVLAGHPDVAECAVIGVADPMKGEVPMGLVVLKAGVEISEEQIQAELVQRVRDEIGPVAAFKQAVVVGGLPKTRSGKVLRRTAKAIAEGEPYTTPSTIEDPAVLDTLSDRIAP